MLLWGGFEGELLLAQGFIGEMTFALQATVGEACEGVEHSEQVVRAGGDGVTEHFWAELRQDLANLGGSKPGDGAIALAGGTGLG